MLAEDVVNRLLGLLSEERDLGGTRIGREFGRLAVALGYVREDQLDAALLEQRRRREAGERIGLGQVLLARGDLTTAQFVELLSLQHRSDYVGKYRVLRLLARGGMAAVYEAEDPDLRRSVALKVAREDETDPRLLARLHREAAIAARLRHPNIVGVHEVGRVRDAAGRWIHFIAMDYVEGETLSKVLRERRPPAVERLRLLEEVLRAAAHAHREGVIHRDLKPENVLVERGGRVVLTDFGLARAAAFATKLTKTQSVMGTPQYMSPEQVRGRTAEIDARTDVYAIGVLLYEAITGRLPYSVNSVPELYEQIVHGEPPAPRRIDPTLSPDLEAVCLKAMAKDRALRYADAGEMLADLVRYRAGEPVTARAPGIANRLRRRLARRPGIAIAAAALLVGLSIAALVRADSDRRLREADTELRRSSQDLLRAALALRRNGDVDEMEAFARRTEEACAAAFQRNPRDPEPHYLLGRMHRARMRDEEALAEQERALEIDPGFAQARYERAVLSARLHQRLLLERWGVEGRRQGPPVLEPDPRLRDSIEEDLAFVTDPEDRRVLQGLAAWLRRDFAKAREWLANSPREEAIETLSMLELEAGAVDEAVRWCAEGIRRDAGYLPYHRLRAACGIRMARVDAEFTGIVERIDAVLVRCSSEVPLRNLRAEAMAAWGDARRSRGEDPTEAYENGRSRLPDRKEFGRMRGELAFRLARWRWERGLEHRPMFEQGLAELQTAEPDLGLHLSRGNLRLVWGMCEPSLTRLEEAVLDFDEALRIDPSSRAARILRGQALAFWGSARAGFGMDPESLYSAAELDFDRAIGLDPSDHAAWLGRGYVRLRRAGWRVLNGNIPQESFESADADFSEALLRREDSDDALVGRASLQLLRCRIEEARDGFREAVSRNPGNLDAWIGLGTAHLRQSRWRDAASAFTEVLSRNERHVRARVGRGIVRMRSGDRAAALDDFDRAALVAPDDFEVFAYRGLTRLLLARETRARADYEAAKSDFLRAREVLPRLAHTLEEYLRECD